ARTAAGPGEGAGVAPRGGARGGALLLDHADAPAARAGQEEGGRGSGGPAPDDRDVGARRAAHATARVGSVARASSRSGAKRNSSASRSRRASVRSRFR